MSRAARTPNPDYPTERTLPGAMARLLSEDWSAMTDAARNSPNHPGRDEGWARKAKEANPALDDDQAHRLGQIMKRAHFAKMGKLSAEARRIAREAEREMA